MKKILFISHTADLAGAEKSLFTLLKNIDKAKYMPLVVLPCEGPLRIMINNLGIKTIVYPVQRWIAFNTEYGRYHFKEVLVGLPKRVAYLSKIIKNEKIDLVYTNTITCIDGAIAAKVNRIPHIWHIREILRNNTAIRTYVPLCLLKGLVNIFSSKIIFVSSVCKEELFKKTDNHRDKIRIIYNGFDVEEFPSKGTGVCSKKSFLNLDFSADTRIVASFGTFFEAKGQKDFIKSAKIVSDRIDKVVFILMGGGSKAYLKELKEMIGDLDLNNVYFFNFHDNVIPLYKPIDVFVSPSHVEALGRAIVEAMLMGKPVIATKCGGPEELVENGKTGFLVPIKSPEHLANAIIKVLSNPSLCDDMGKAAREKALRLYSLPNYVSSVESVIDDSLKYSQVPIMSLCAPNRLPHPRR